MAEHQANHSKSFKHHKMFLDLYTEVVKYGTLRNDSKAFVDLDGSLL